MRRLMGKEGLPKEMVSKNLVILWHKVWWVGHHLCKSPLRPRGKQERILSLKMVKIWLNILQINKWVPTVWELMAQKEIFTPNRRTPRFKKFTPKIRSQISIPRTSDTELTVNWPHQLIKICLVVKAYLSEKIPLRTNLVRISLTIRKM